MVKLKSVDTGEVIEVNGSLQATDFENAQDSTQPLSKWKVKSLVILLADKKSYEVVEVREK